MPLHLDSQYVIHIRRSVSAIVYFRMLLVSLFCGVFITTNFAGAHELPGNVLELNGKYSDTTKPKWICFTENDTEDVLTVRASKDWKCQEVTLKTIGYSSHKYWFHTRYKLSDPRPWTVQLMYGYGMYDTASAVFISARGAMKKYINLGADAPFDAKPINSPELTLPLLNDGSDYVDLFVRVGSDKAIIYGPVFAEDHVNLRDMYLYAIWVIASSSFTLASLLFFFIYSYSKEDKSIAFLATGAVLAIMWQWTTTGVGYWLLWGNKTHLQMHGVMSFACFGSGFLAIFLYDFLRKSVPSKRFSNFLAAFFLPAAVVQFTIAIGNNIVESIVWGIISGWSNLMAPWIMCVVIIYIAVKHDKTVRWMTIGGVVISFGVSTVAAQTFDFIPLQLGTSPINALPLLFLFFSFAIMDRRITKKKIYMKQLEHRVQDQTRGLQLQNEALQKLVEASRQAVNDQIKFFRVVTHDLRSPLNAVGLRIQALRQKYFGTENGEIQEELMKSEQGLDMAAMIINEHLQTFSGHVSQTAGHIQQVNVIEIVNSAIAMMAPILRIAGIEIAKVANVEPPAIAWGNKVLIQNVLENLITNVTRYCPHGTPAKIEVLVGGATIDISVIDNGPGLPEEIAKNPFDMMDDKIRKSSNATGSTGQGLYIVKFLAIRMQGSMAYKRTENGHSIFTLSLLAVSQNEAQSMQESTKSLEHFMSDH